MIPIICGILVGVGVFFIIADLMKMPYIKTSKAISNLSKRQNKKTSTVELWLKDLSAWIARHLKLNECRRMQLVSDLQTAGLNISSELHIANALVKAGICGLLTIPAFFIFPLIVPVVLTLAIAMYYEKIPRKNILTQANESVKIIKLLRNEKRE